MNRIDLRKKNRGWLNMNEGRKEDIQILTKMPKEKLVDLLFLQMRNLWTVDGLYYLGIERRFGTEAATEIDKNVWEVMGKIEARRLKNSFSIKGNDIPTLMEALKITSWSLDLEDKQIVIEDDKGIFRNTKCRVQETRLSKGLEEFPCKEVRWGYLKNFAKEFNENIEVECRICPPDKHQQDLWCEWVFRLKS